MDLWLLLVAVLLVVAVPFDWIIAGIWLGVALVKPPIAVLQTTAKRHVIYAVVASFAGLLGIQTIALNAYGIRIFPAPIPTVLIVLILVGVSVPNVLSVKYLVEISRREVEL